MSETPRADLARLPQVDALLRHHDAEQALAGFGRRATTEALRRALEDARTRGRRGGPLPRPDELVAAATADLEERRAGRLARVINATGVVLHTNLGRAPLSAAARDAVNDAAGYTTLEYDLADGRRTTRTAHVGRLAAEACGSEAATVVNNGAAAVVLVLAALAAGREVIVSRGELVEIGGSFRLPDIMIASGAVLREVGTTNRTRVEDYRAALNDRTGLVLRVHRSNYRVVGFASDPTAADVAGAARAAGVPFVYDLGSGLLRDVGGPFADEPSVASALADGADLVVFSGDKLLGGPQAGIIAGRGDLVLRCDRHPLARALRVDKLQRAAMEVTLEAHLRADLPSELPVWAMLTADPEALHARADALATALGQRVTAVEVTSLTGGGSLPGRELASWAVALPGRNADALAAALRAGEPAVVGRVDDGRVMLDLRTVPPAQDDLLLAAVRAALAR